MTADRTRFKIREARFFLDRLKRDMGSLMRENPEAIQYYVSAFLNAMYSVHDALEKAKSKPLRNLPADDLTHALRMKARRNSETYKLPQTRRDEAWVNGRNHPKVVIVGNAASKVEVQIAVQVLRFTDGPKDIVVDACERYWASLKPLADGLK